MAIAQISGSSVTFDVNVGMQEAEAKNLDTVSVAVKNSDDSGEGGWATGIFN
jgi:hypothetical protein